MSGGLDLLERIGKTAPISTWALFGAGVGISIMLIGMVFILWLGGWELATAPQRINYLGTIAVLLALDVAVVIASLAKARVSAHGPGGVSYEISTDQPPAAPAQTVTTTTKIQGSPP